MYKDSTAGGPVARTTWTAQPRKACFGQAKDCFWQKDLGKEGTPLALMQMPGALLKTACNQLFGKQIFDSAIKYLNDHGGNVRGEWKDSGWESQKNKLCVRVADGENLFLHGNPSFVHREAFSTKFPDLVCEKAHLTCYAAALHRFPQ